MEACISVFPIVDFKVEAFVEGEKEVAVGDILTIRITVDQLNLKEGENGGFIHSNNYPFLKQGNWYLVFTDPTETEIFTLDKLSSTDKVFTKEMKERMGQPGKI